MKNFLFAIVVFIPSVAFAAAGDVVINEVAWSGTKAQNVGSSDEWIELRNNTSAPVSLDGWTLKAKDATPNIQLSGSVPAGGFYLLERSEDNNAVSDVAYDGYFTGALVNLPAGEDLELFDAAGAIVDSVLFSSGWPAGTAGPDYFSMERIDPKQDGSLASNWATNTGTKINGKDAAGTAINGTPKQENSVFNNLSSSPASASSSSSLLSSSSASPSLPIYPALVVDAGSDRTVLVGSSVSFLGLALGINNTPLLDARFLWNFGDGAIQEGRALEHVYYFPGTYTAALTVSSGPYSGFDTALITAVVPQLSVKNTQAGNDGFVVIANGSDARIDLGSMILRDSAGAQFLIPKNTFVLPKSETTFPNLVSGLLKSGGAVLLHDAAGREVRALQLTTNNIQQTTSPSAVSEPVRAAVKVSPPAGGGTLNVKNKIIAREDAPALQKEIAAVSPARAQRAGGQASQSSRFAVSKSILFFGASVLVGVISSAGFFLLKSFF